MSKDGKTMQERFQTILREGRLLAQDAGHRVASFSRWAYRDVMQRLGWGEEHGKAREVPSSTEAAGAAAEAPKGAGKTSPEGYAVGQVWTPKDPSKKARKVVEVKEENGEFFLVWQSPDGGKKNRIKEDSFTRWVRRESAHAKG